MYFPSPPEQSLPVQLLRGPQPGALQAAAQARAAAASLAATGAAEGDVAPGTLLTSKHLPKASRRSQKAVYKHTRSEEKTKSLSVCWHVGGQEKEKRPPQALGPMASVHTTPELGPWGCPVPM